MRGCWKACEKEVQKSGTILLSLISVCAGLIYVAVNRSVCVLEIEHLNNFYDIEEIFLGKLEALQYIRRELPAFAA